jgi:dTDP-4-dehydrorhamnose 3,5-epimerase
MIISETRFAGVFIIEPTCFEDERGFFASAWSESELRARDVDARFIAGNISFNKHCGTLRGMHYQAAPHGQSKLLRCTRGAIFDVGIDLRPDSPTFKQWIGVELTAENHLMLYLPAEFAHGYLTLKDDTEVHYEVTDIYAPESARGFRWNDPAFGIQWPSPAPLKLNKRDREFPDFKL